MLQFSCRHGQSRLGQIDAAGMAVASYRPGVFVRLCLGPVAVVTARESGSGVSGCGCAPLGACRTY